MSLAACKNLPRGQSAAGSVPATLPLDLPREAGVCPPLLRLDWLEDGAEDVVGSGEGADRDRGGGMDHEVIAADEPAGEAR